MKGGYKDFDILRYRRAPLKFSPSCNMSDTGKNVSSDFEKWVGKTRHSQVNCILTNFEVFGNHFSNSLIIHQAKTKEITTVEEV